MRVMARVLIGGRVQGVGYRYWVRRKAGKLGLKGWVRNSDDGGVEAVFEGKEQEIKKMVDWCREGPPLAGVVKVEVNKYGGDKDWQGFEIRR